MPKKNCIAACSLQRAPVHKQPARCNVRPCISNSCRLATEQRATVGRPKPLQLEASIQPPLDSTDRAVAPPLSNYVLLPSGVRGFVPTRHLTTPWHLPCPALPCRRPSLRGFLSTRHLTTPSTRSIEHRPWSTLDKANLVAEGGYIYKRIQRNPVTGWDLWKQRPSEDSANDEAQRRLPKN